MLFTLKFIRTSEWSNVTKYKNCYTTLTAGLSRTGQRATGLTPEKERELEEKLGFESGTLNKSNNEYWDKFAIKVPSHGITLNTMNALDELYYEFLSHYHRVANGIQNIKPSNDFVLINDESEAKVENIAAKSRRTAIREFEKLSLDDMRKWLRIIGVRSDSMNTELIENRAFKEVEKDPNGFLTKWVNNKQRETTYLIEQAISKNIIRRNKSIYLYGTDTIGHSLTDAIAYLDDKQNSDIRRTITAELEAKSKQ
jgi:hypothetical protein